MDSTLILHLSYLLLVAASMVRAIMILRILAILSGITAVVYDWNIGEPEMVAWEAAFALVNCVQVAILLYERRSARLTPEEETLRRRMFSQLSVVHFHRLMHTGTWISTPEGKLLTVQGAPVARIVLLTDGVTSIDVDGKTVAYCRQGDFIGEMAFLSGNAASASVATIAPSRYLMWRFEDLRELLGKFPDIKTALESVFNQNLIEKISRETSENTVQIQ